MNKSKHELGQLGIQELIVKVHEYGKELFALRLNAATSHVKDNSQFKKTRKNLARALTYLRQRVNNG